MKGTKRAVALVQETESMHKFQIILDIQLILRGSITASCMNYFSKLQTKFTNQSTV